MNKSNENFLVVQNAIDMTSDEAFKILEQEDDNLKPYALLNIEKVSNQKEANLIVFHLTNHSNPTREATAFKLNEIRPYEFLQSEKILNTLQDGICDINPNICRSIIELLSSDEKLSAKIMPLNILRIENLLEQFSEYEKEFGAFADNKMRNRKNHAKNKKLFNLYWCLEALAETYKNNTEFDEKIVNISQKTVDFLDYTIREKTAKMLVKLENPPQELLQKLKNDENFYVKNLVYDKICEDSNK